MCNLAKKIFVGVRVLLLVTSSAFANDCDKLIEKGVFDLYTSTDQSSYMNDVREALELVVNNKNADEFSSKTSVKALYKAFYGAYRNSSDQKHLTDLYQKFAKEGSNSLQQNEYKYILHITANKALIDGFNTCIQEGFGLQLKCEYVNTENPVLVCRWAANNGVNDAEIAGVTISGGTFLTDQELKAGTRISTGSIRQQIKRNGIGSIIITVNLKDGRGSASFFIPPIEAVPVDRNEEFTRLVINCKSLRVDALTKMSELLKKDGLNCIKESSGPSLNDARLNAAISDFSISSNQLKQGANTEINSKRIVEVLDYILRLVDQNCLINRM